MSDVQLLSSLNDRFWGEDDSLYRGSVADPPSFGRPKMLQVLFSRIVPRVYTAQLTAIAEHVLILHQRACENPMPNLKLLKATSHGKSEFARKPQPEYSPGGCQAD